MNRAQCEPFKRAAWLALLTAGLSGCGGGGGGDDGIGEGSGDTGTAYVNWVDSANGNVVVDADNEEYRVSADGRQIEDRSGRRASGMTVDADARVVVNGEVVGQVQLVDATGGGRIAALRCTDGSAMDVTFHVDNTYSYACAGTGAGAPGGAGAGAGTGEPDAAGYLNFIGNSNGTVVLDSENERFQVAADTRTVVDRSNVRLSGLMVDANGNVLRNGTVIGGVVLTNGSTGGMVAVFRCNNGGDMDLTVGVQGWGHACGAPGSAGNGAGSGGNTGDNDGTGGGGATRTYIRWNGSANGEVVLDASDDPFKFNSATRCLYSVNRDTEYDNFCLAGENTVNFDGTFYTVSRILSTRNTCITGLLTADGYKADIVTGGNRIDSIRPTTERPVSC